MKSKHSLALTAHSLSRRTHPAVSVQGIVAEAKVSPPLRLRVNELEGQVAALRQAYVRLEDKHNRYLDLYELSPVGCMTLKRDGRIAEINLTAARLVGLDRESLVGREFASLLTPRDVEPWRLFFDAQVRCGGAHNAEFMLAVAAGDDICVRLDCLGVQRDDHDLAMHVTLTDVTEKKRAEKELLEQEAFFRLITENLDGFVAVLDVNGRRIYNSPSYARLLGDRISPGADSFADIHPADRQRVMTAFHETVATGVGQHLEYRFLLADGSTRQMDSRGGVIRDATGRIVRVVVVSYDVTDRRAAEEIIHYQAFHDALTQLPNRLMLSDRLRQAMAVTKRKGRYAALMFLDLDHFKPVNDGYGHDVGDRLLIEAAGRIGGCVREIDTVARFGGDEFVVMLTELDADADRARGTAELVAEKIRMAIARPFSLALKASDGSSGSSEHHCTASIGVVLFRDHEASDAEILKAADVAMYRAKEQGRNRACVDGPVVGTGGKGRKTAKP